MVQRLMSKYFDAVLLCSNCILMRFDGMGWHELAQAGEERLPENF